MELRLLLLQRRLLPREPPHRQKPARQKISPRRPSFFSVSYYRDSSRAWVSLLAKPITNFFLWAGEGFLFVPALTLAVAASVAAAKSATTFLETDFLTGAAATAGGLFLLFLLGSSAADESSFFLYLLFSSCSLANNLLRSLISFFRSGM